MKWQEFGLFSKVGKNLPVTENKPNKHKTQMNRQFKLTNAIYMICVISATLLSSCSKNEKEKEEVFQPFGRDTTYHDANGDLVEISNYGYRNHQRKITTQHDTITYGDVTMFLQQEHTKKRWNGAKRPSLRDTSYTNTWWIEKVKIGDSWELKKDYESSDGNVCLRVAEGTGYYLAKGDTLKLTGISVQKFSNREPKPSEKEEYSELYWKVYESAEPLVKKAVKAMIKLHNEEKISVKNWGL